MHGNKETTILQFEPFAPIPLLNMYLTKRTFNEETDSKSELQCIYDDGIANDENDEFYYSIMN